ncbi:DegT/DnrJ/EryC1/StrS family aminotransferase [Rathayibacter sp. YIM 133350]|uniref:DegT/DnrJ/EryC1/StrS family aminotransferase n=1 Tax=Rathayibacter sp. YIM 133350 TaxID=3131992 RepID=UPI00307D726D
MAQALTVPFLDLNAQQAEIADEVLPAWERIFRSSSFVGGPEVEGFEREFAEFSGARFAVGVANGTDAIELALRALEIEPGAEVILPVNTFIATAEAVSRVGATPVFVDVDPDFLLIDPDAVAAAVTPRTQAIIAVHLYGQVAPIGALLPIAARAGIPLIEDNAQAQGASSLLGRTGSLGTIAATSFYPGKNLGAAGDAGAVTTDDAGLAHAVRELAAHGSSVKYVHERIGVNSRLDAVQAVVLSAKLRRLEDWNAHRRAAAARYAELLEPLGVQVPRTRPGNLDVWHLYVARFGNRDEVARELAARGIGTAIHYPTPLHLTAAYAGAGLGRGLFPVAEAAAGRILSLPMFPHLTEQQQELVADALADVLTGTEAIRAIA